MRNSIIIPTYNGEKYLRSTLVSLINQKFDKADFEILIIDNCSTDKTREIAKSIITQHPGYQIEYIYESTPGLLSGRHKGAVQAKGDLLIFVDDDIEADEYWLEAINKSFEDLNIHMVGGRNLPKYEISPPQWLDYYWSSTQYGGKILSQLSLLDFGEKEMQISPMYIWGLNLSIRKTTFFKIGGFNPDTYPKYLQRFQGDGESGLSSKLIDHGYKATYQPGAIVYHIIPKERMTEDFFIKRRYFQAVADSYTDIRKSNGITQLNKLDYFLTIIKKYTKLTFSIRKNFVKKEPAIIRKLNAKMAIAYKKGKKFHQKELKNDTSLLKWILKDNYFEYVLPEYIQKNKYNTKEKSY